MAHTHPLLEALFPRRSASMGDQLASLTHDVSALARQLRRQASPHVHDAAHSVSGFAGDLLHQLEPLGRDVAHRAKVAGRAVRDDPVPAVVALGTFSLIATLLLSSGSSGRRSGR